ncbi:enoyl-CoA hydratase/isomerase family protein [Mesorhizobium sp. LHD-90]|uniref:enoyl-CoA hydratase/isomerase family protein n=1 Tax=Mesorhizobium sp. LHD-90 TaxID=3071414 RepID=UPI0027E1E3D6|nr:enoyl-CoA hydratase/isomerase family protein [Mesorhizobium sp. LHD-90]MDQ6432545.1 enoyl-CoA hydratase/isomerase family protein [Mesorhizobium sp. LHD-90]
MQDQDDGAIEYSVDDRIAHIEINRPAKHNALTLAQIGRLGEALDRFDTDTKACVAVLSGRGKSFCSGADVAESQMASREQMAASRDQMSIGHPFFELFNRSLNNKPVVAALHGNVLGLGLGLALDCDLIVCDAAARLQVTETSRGLGGYRHLALMKARGCGIWADEICLTGRFFSAEEACQAGLFNRVAPPGEALDAAFALARGIAANPPLSVRETNRIRRWHFARHVREIAFETGHLKLQMTQDFEEAVRAMAEKRTPGPFRAC